MKITIDIPERVVFFWTEEAKALKVSLEDLVLAKALGSTHNVTGDFEIAPPPVDYVPPSPTCACPHCLLRCPNPPRQNSPAQCGSCHETHPEPDL